MYEEALLAEQFQQLLARQRQAAEAYADLASKSADGGVSRQFSEFQRDMQRHIDLTRRLLEIVQ